MNQSILRQLLVTFACLLPFLLVIIIILANTTEREIGESTGNKVARRALWTIPLIFLVVLFFGLLAQHIEIDDWIPLLQISIGFGLAITGGSLWFIRRRQIEAEVVVYDMGRVESLTVRMAGIIFGLGFLLMLAMGIGEGNLQFSDFGFYAFIGGAAIYWNLFGQGRVYLTKNGLFRFSTGLIPWEKIESYEWGGKFNRSLIFNTAKGKVWFPLKIMQHDEVEAVVSQFFLAQKQVLNNDFQNQSGSPKTAHELNEQ